MPLYTIDFRANVVKGPAPLEVTFYPIVDITGSVWQDGDSPTQVYQDGESVVLVQDVN